ncbi:hypothetical protein SAMN04487995_3284 [Dyadobacter koreensis]|uniref:Uncharacterized protein n=1 Tax=Dyadobacter koreensis TaxID=408657 RepID=A0A1H6W3B5_9BACT|nr:hypothetical protein [Dyadobacter koreensis]SEJ11428.1 hypothetical protein SAMN04487995_3284 [Dyadobacter koreensis]
MLRKLFAIDRLLFQLYVYNERYTSTYIMDVSFLVNLRNMFYTRSSRISDEKRFGYKLSMSAMILPCYFAILSILKVVIKSSDDCWVLRRDHGDSLFEKLIKSVIFFLPLVVVMFSQFKLLDKYEKVILNKTEENKWLLIASVIFFGGIIILFTIPRFLIQFLSKN